MRVSSLVLADVARPAQWHFEDELFGCGRASFEVGDVADAAFVESLVAGADDLSIFHLGAVMSGQGEAEFDVCLDVNLRGTMVSPARSQRDPNRQPSEPIPLG